VLYPNPVKEGNAVHLLPVGPMEVKVYTVASRRVAHWVLEDGRIPLIDTSGTPLANGLYYLVVQIGEKKFQLKLIVLR
jgi:hypothetical protein